MRINAKDSHIFSTKITGFAYVDGIHITSRGFNDDVKLTKF